MYFVQGEGVQVLADHLGGLQHIQHFLNSAVQRFRFQRQLTRITLKRVDYQSEEQRRIVLKFRPVSATLDHQPTEHSVRDGQRPVPSKPSGSQLDRQSGDQHGLLPSL